MSLMSTILPTLLDGLFELESFAEMSENISERDLVPFHQAVAALNEGVVMVNYKKEFHSILGIIAEVAKDEELMDALIKGDGFESLMKEEGNFFSIDEKHVGYFKNAICQMDDSAILYNAMAPIMKSFLMKEDTDSTLFEMGLRSDVIIAAINQDMKKSKHTLFEDLSEVLDSKNWKSLNTVYSLTGDAGDSDALMNKLADEDTISAFTDILKMIQKNKVINPKPSKTDDFEENENLYGLLEFVFNNTEGMGLTVTRPLMREVEDWDKEFDAIGKILHHVASRDIMNASDIFSGGGLTSSAIKKLNGTDKGDLDLPGLFRLIDDSHIFANTFGPFLDENMGDSGLIDKENNVCYSNVKEGQWKQEGDNLSSMLDSLATISDESGGDILAKLDLDGVSNIVDLNSMLHELAHSNMFDYLDEKGVRHYQFGKWFYSKISSSLGEFTVDEGTKDEKTFDLLADPKTNEHSTWEWDKEQWGYRPGDDGGVVDPIFLEWKLKYDNNPAQPAPNTRYIAYRDFIDINGHDYNKSSEYSEIKTFWCNYADNDDGDATSLGFKSLHTAFSLNHKNDIKTNYLTDNEWHKIFGSEQFMSDYNDIFEIDEISRIARVLSYSLRITQAKANGETIKLDGIPQKLLSDLLTSLNETCCMRIGLYNFYCIASDSIFKNDNGFSLASAYNKYLVDVDLPIDDYDNGRLVRQDELDILINFYGFINDAKDAGVMNNGSFDIKKLTEQPADPAEPRFLDRTKEAMKELNDSFVFQCEGSSVDNDITVFQGIFKKILTDTEDIKKLIYMEESPKDIAGINEGLFAQGADELKTADNKVEYIVTHVFKDNPAIEDAGLDIITDKADQKIEVDNVFDCVDKLYSLQDKEGHDVADPNDINIDTINPSTVGNLLTSLNNSGLLYDCVPNMMYKMFIKDSKMEIKNGEETVDFKRTDPYYHYYYFVDGYYRDAADYTERYDANDINGIETIIADYQTFNAVKGNNDLAHRNTLRSLTTGDNSPLENILKDMYESNLFHTPARDNHYANYYVNLFSDTEDAEGKGFTLFEEMMSKLCSFVGLDDFAYDADYQPDVDNYGNADKKLQHNIDAITVDDDDGLGHSYKPQPNVGAWPQEIKTIVVLANHSCDLGTGDNLDVNAIKFDELSPLQIKTMLNSINDSDLVGDAVPGFIEKGFDNVGITKLSTYDPSIALDDEINHNYYRLGQVLYGDYEIDSIHDVMESIANYTNPADETTFTGYKDNLGNLNVKDLENRNIEGIVKYIYRSRILNTHVDENYNTTYNKLYEDFGSSISAQGILFYNALGNDLTGYIAKDTANTPKTTLEKIASLSKLVHFQTTDELTDEPLAFDDIRDEVESTAIIKMVAETKKDGLEIHSSSFDDIAAIKSRQAIIMNIVKAAYDAYGDDSNERSYIVSEFSSGLFNTVFETEYPKIGTHGYAYNQDYSFGQNDASLIERDSYDTINVIEYNGVDGALSMLDYINDVSNPENTGHVRDNFAKMGAEPGNNSMFGRVIYLAEAHETFDSIVGFTAVGTASYSPDDDNNVYSNTFCFAEYGDSLYNHFHP